MEISDEEKIKNLSQEIENCKSIINKKDKCYIQHKLLNNLINIYQHKVDYFSQSVPKKANKLSFPKHSSKHSVNLPSIYKSKTIKTSSSMSKTKSTNNFFFKQKPKENQHEVLQLKRKIQEEKRRQQAKDLRDKMKIMNDNFKIYKESLIFENINKRKIIETQRELVKDSINNYRMNKKRLIDSLNENDIERVSRLNQRKLNELNFLKMTYQNKTSTKTSPKDSNINSHYSKSTKQSGVFLTNTPSHLNEDLNSKKNDS